jgi:serine/threonine protein kinase
MAISSVDECCGAGTVAYCAPELLKDGKLTKAADVYSFAMIMWEMYTGTALFRGMNSTQVRARAARLQKQSRCSALCQAVPLVCVPDLHMEPHAVVMCTPPPNVCHFAYPYVAAFQPDAAQRERADAHMGYCCLGRYFSRW